MFKLQVGDVVQLNEVIPGLYRSSDWKTGLYVVTGIGATFCHQSDAAKPEFQSYQFAKVRRDGTRIKSFLNGYRCLAWDQMIDSGQVSIVTKVSAAA